MRSQGCGLIQSSARLLDEFQSAGGPIQRRNRWRRGVGIPRSTGVATDRAGGAESVSNRFHPGDIGTEGAAGLTDPYRRGPATGVGDDLPGPVGIHRRHRHRDRHSPPDRIRPPDCARLDGCGEPTAGALVVTVAGRTELAPALRAFDQHSLENPLPAEVVRERDFEHRCALEVDPRLHWSPFTGNGATSRPACRRRSRRRVRSIRRWLQSEC